MVLLLIFKETVENGSIQFGEVFKLLLLEIEVRGFCFKVDLKSSVHDSKQGERACLNLPVIRYFSLKGMPA